MYSSVNSADIFSAIGTFMSIKLNINVSQQSNMLAVDLSAMMNKNLQGQHNIFRLKMDDIMNDIDQVIKDIIRHPELAENVEILQVTKLTTILNSIRKNTDSVDFVLLMSTKGKHIASSPSDTGDDVDTPWLEAFYQSWELEKRIESILKDESKDNKQISHAIKKHDADFIKAFCLTEHNFTANEFISASSATIINDDFGDPRSAVKDDNLYGH